MEKLSGILRNGSDNAHTRDDCEDKREAKEEERMAIKFTPVQSGQAIPIGAGSELIRLKYRHEDFLGEEERRQTIVGAVILNGICFTLLRIEFGNLP